MNGKYICLAAAALVLGSCSKDLTENAGVKKPASNKLVLFGNYGDVHNADGTRVSISGDDVAWKADDAIGVFAAASVEPAYFELTSGAGTASAAFEGEVGVEEGDEIYVVSPYFPDQFEFDMKPSAVKLIFNGQTQDGFGANAEAHLGDFAYMAAAPVKVTDGKASVQFKHLAVKMSFEFSLPEAATVRFLSITTASNKLYDKGIVDLTAANPTAKAWGTASRSLSMGFKNAKVAAGQKVTAHMMMLPVDLSSTEITFYISAEKEDGSPVTYTMKKSKGLNFVAETSYTAEITGLSVFDTHVPMVYVPGGSLNICGIFDGDDAANQALVNKDYKVNSFWIGKTEVTNQQYCDFLNDRKPSDFQIGNWLSDSEGQLQIEQKGGTWVPKSGDILNADKTTKHTGSYADYPMIGVTYLGASAYTFWIAERKLGYPEKDGLGVYLPSELQWEYAAVGSEWNPNWDSEYLAGGNDPDELMWYCGNCDSEGSSCIGMYMGNNGVEGSMNAEGSWNGGTHPVARLKPNYLGLYDMSGNVSELCADWFCTSQYPYGSALDPRCTDISAADSFYGEESRSVRGGLWQSYAAYGVTWERDAVTWSWTSTTTGFRPMLTLR